MKPTRLYIARAALLFYSLSLLFGGVLHDIAVVVSFKSLILRAFVDSVLIKSANWKDKLLSCVFALSLLLR